MHSVNDNYETDKAAVIQALESNAPVPLKHINNRYDRPGESFNNTLLLQAIIRGDEEFALTLVNQSVTEDLGEMLNQTDAVCNNTPLILAINNGFIDLAVALIRSGATIEDKANDDFTALHYACLHKQNAVIVALLAHNPPASENANRRGAFPADYYQYDMLQGLDNEGGYTSLGARTSGNVIPDLGHAIYHRALGGPNEEKLKPFDFKETGHTEAFNHRIVDLRRAHVKKIVQFHKKLSLCSERELGFLDRKPIILKYIIQIADYLKNVDRNSHGEKRAEALLESIIKTGIQNNRVLEKFLESGTVTNVDKDYSIHRFFSGTAASSVTKPTSLRCQLLAVQNNWADSLDRQKVQR